MLILTLSRRLLLSAFLLLFSLPVFSETYYWSAPYPDSTIRHPSMAAACSVLTDYYESIYPGYVAESSTLTNKTATSAYCNITLYRAQYDHRLYVGNAISRRGDSCPEGETYDPDTGSCSSPCNSDMPFPARAWGSVVTSADNRRYVVTQPPTACYQSCVYSDPTARAVSCYASMSDDSRGWCNYIIKSTGQACSAENYDQASSADSQNLNPSDPPPPPVTCPSGWSSAYVGGPCFPNPKDDTDPPDLPPNANDGSGNPPPTGGGGGNSGGSGNDGDGGNDSGGPSGGTGSTGDFDFAKGNKTPESGTSGQGDTLVGTDCNQPLVCTGDATSCAILYEQKVANCSLQWTPGIRDQVSDVFEGSDYELQEQTTGFAGALNQALAKGRFLPSSCPSPKTLTFFGKSYQLSWQPVCTFAVTIAPVLVALACLFFAIAIARAVRK